jgi:hypothetical protein
MDPKIIWENTLDREYRCYVREQIDTWGYLCMERLDTGKEVLRKAVPISRYFRPQDVLWWGRECLRKSRALSDEIV